MKIKLRMRLLGRFPLFIVALSCSVMFAVAGAKAAADQSSSQDSTQSPEFKAAEDAAQRYMEAYDKGDAKTLACFYAEDVDYIDQDGAEMKGREAVQNLLADNFQANPGRYPQIMTVDEVKLLTPDVRVNRGIATVTPKDGAAMATRYVAIECEKRRSMADLPTHRNGCAGPKCVFPAPGAWSG